MEKEKRELEKVKVKCKKAQRNQYIPCFLLDAHYQKIILLVGLSLVVSLLVTPSFTVDSPTYQLGDVADRNIKAKADFLIQDRDATTRKREEAVRQSPLVYDLDESVLRSIQTRIESAFGLMRESLDQKKLGPTADASIPDRASDAAPMAAVSAVMDRSRPASPQPLPRTKKDLEGLLGFMIPDRIFSDLQRRSFNADIQDKVLQLTKATIAQGIVSNKARSIEARGENVVVRKLGSQEETVVKPPHSYPNLDEARRYARMQALEQGLDPKEMKTVMLLVSELLQPNLSFNLDETQRRREQAASSVKPVYIQLLKNEMLIREGQKIGPEELLKLKAHEQRGPNQNRSLVFVTLFLFCGLCVSVVAHVAKHHLPSYRMQVEDLLFLAILMAFLLVLGRATMGVTDIIGESSGLVAGKTLIYAVPLTAGAMIASIFFGVTASIIFSLLLTLFAGMLFGKDFGLYFYFLIGSFVAAHRVYPCRNRIAPIRAGLLVGCINIALIVLSALLQDQWDFLRIFTNTFFGFIGGIFAGVLVIGFTPLVELIFGYTTDIKLLELATMDQPLLQELMVQSPGTYHHSIIVGNMVEASAKSIGANALLAKVAAYYHDIGKIRKPLYFIENQFDCENRHEKLAPSMSSLILISHVKEGVELARQNRLGKDIIDIISQHHGKSFISFFYKKAQEAREKIQSTKGSELPPIDIDDYRYPGPKPQTKEAGLVMLADVVEAACRSLTEPTPARIQGMVNRLINNIFSDGQLDECELTLKDLHQIAKHFNQILATVHHKRIEYPSAPCDCKGKIDATDPSQRESRPDRDRPAANRESGRTDLKRLGIH